MIIEHTMQFKMKSLQTHSPMVCALRGIMKQLTNKKLKRDAAQKTTLNADNVLKSWEPDKISWD